MELDSSNIDEVFRALDAQTGVFGGTSINLVVCGGTALAALGLINRTTKDTDVLGTIEKIEGEFHIYKIEKFPDWLVGAAQVVARDFGLPEYWLNLGPASQLESGLPDGFETRLIPRNYGKFLDVYYTGRIDQIHFKLYAAVDRDDYHTQDLAALKPNEDELEAAAKWVLTQDVSETFMLILKDFLRKNGYEKVAEKI